MHNFEKLIFWKKSMMLAKEIYLMSSNLPTDEKFGLVSQMKRSAVSIPSNIAEGSGRNSNRELVISCHRAWFGLRASDAINFNQGINLITDNVVETLISDLIEIQKMIYGFKNTLKI